MYRLLAPLLLVLLLASALPLPAQAGMPLFDPDWHIVPDPHDFDDTCPVGAPLGFAGVLVLIQNLMNAAVSLGILISVLVIAFAGVLWILTPTNPENHSKAKKVLTNAVIGLLIILSAWLVVDFLMKTLYDADMSGFGPWNTILVGGEYCIVKNDKVQGLFARGISPVTGGGGGGGGSASGPASVGTGRCSPSTILSAAADGGYTLTQAQANTFSCIAKSESSCGTRISGATTPSGRPTSAYGMFQIVLGTPDSACHSLNLPVCTAAAQRAGWTGTGNLNCENAFSGGRVKRGQEALARACQAAAANISCNVSAAACLLQRRPNFGDWTSDVRSSRQQACINTFAGG